MDSELQLAESSPDISEPTTENPDNNSERKFVKFGSQEGSNEGGWYKDESTKERFYLKFYRDINQGKMEVIANKVYEKLGIPAPQSELVNVDGRQAVASKEIIGHHRVTAQTLEENTDVLNGFVADTFLANWDVVGLVYDNIEKAQDGRMYRIDNGGVLTFRAQGGLKTYSSDTVGELETLRNPSINRQSTEVFKSLTDMDLREQAEHLVDTLSPNDITTIVDQADLPSDLAATVKNGMMGRREYLIKRFNLEKRMVNQQE